MDLCRRGDRLVEDEPEVSSSHRRTKQQFGALAFRNSHAVRLTLRTQAGRHAHFKRNSGSRW
jgi:hypothetical protein